MLACKNAQAICAVFAWQRYLDRIALARQFVTVSHPHSVNKKVGLPDLPD